MALCEGTSALILFNNTSAEDISKQLLTISDGRAPLNELSGLILFPHNFCNFDSSKYELMYKVFPSTITNYRSEWLGEREIFVDGLNYII